MDTLETKRFLPVHWTPELICLFALANLVMLGVAQRPATATPLQTGQTDNCLEELQLGHKADLCAGWTKAGGKGGRKILFCNDSDVLGRKYIFSGVSVLGLC